MMQKFLLSIILCFFFLSCFIPSDGSLDESTRHDVKMILLNKIYNDAGGNDHCEDSLDRSTRIDGTAYVTLDLSNEDKSINYVYLQPNKSIYNLTFSIEGDQCFDVKIKFRYCNTNRNYYNASTTCLDGKIVNASEKSYSCTLDDNVITTQRIEFQFVKYNKLNRCNVTVSTVKKN